MFTRILFLFITFVKICHAIVSILEYSNIKACRVREKDCAKPTPPHVSLNYMRRMYGGCTHVIGNLVICNLQRLDNGSDPDLSFLENIVDVSGYVYLHRNTVRRIPLTSLRVIRGEPAYKIKNESASFIIWQNGLNSTYGLEVIDLRNLTGIQHNHVIAWDNPLLCNFGFTVDWQQIFDNPKAQRFISYRKEQISSHSGCDLERTRYSCHGSCPIIGPKSLCWGSGVGMCQKTYKCLNDQSKYCLEDITDPQPCQEECLGGCDGQPGNCRACRHAMNDGKCVAQCPPPVIVNREDSRTIVNPEFKYNFYDICVKTCPAPFLKSGIFCVIECDLSVQTPVNGTCKECPKSGCPEHCTEEQVFGKLSTSILQLDALNKLKSCVYYTGALYLSKESFIKSSVDVNPIKNIAQLWNLNKLKAIIGYIYFDLRGLPFELKNLSFLENLESIIMEVKDKSPGPVLTIFNGEHLELLGFRSLRTVEGRVFLRNLPKLCYTSALTKLVSVRMVNVQDPGKCKNRGNLCHSECLPEAGCWGPEANMCAHCCSLKAGDYCVSKCYDRPGYYELPVSLTHQSYFEANSSLRPDCRTLPFLKDQIEKMDYNTLLTERVPATPCATCHSECAETCHGPQADQCIGKCTHFRHNNVCVPECPRGTYIDSETNECLPCHDACNRSVAMEFNSICSGPGNFLGSGGCEPCWTVIQNTTTKRYECLPYDCPIKHYAESYQITIFLARENISTLFTTENQDNTEVNRMIRVCKPCHPFCDVCTANGTHSSICHSCLHWWFKSECVEVCPPAETYQPVKQISETLSANKVIGTNSISNISDSNSVGVSRSVRNKQNISQPISLIEVHPPNQTNETNFGRKPFTNLNQAISKIARYCLLCHEECVQGCTGPGPDACVKCKNFKIVDNEDTDKFVCNYTCPAERAHVFHGMCFTAAQYARISGQSARELRNRILIGVAVSVLVFIAAVLVILVVCLRRKAEAEKIREQLRSAYTNLLEPDMKSQSVSREPNMSRLEMINIDDLECDFASEPLGTGAFGAVYRGKWKIPKHALLQYNWHWETNLDVAIKVILPMCNGMTNSLSSFEPKDSLDEAKRASVRANVEDLLQEAKVMASVSHRHCLPLIGVCLSGERNCLVSAYVELGSLDRYVRQNATELNSFTLLSWAEQIADGMNYLSMRGIIHRDLAARNVLVQTRDHVQITDFGLAKMLERYDEDSVVVKAGRVPIRWLSIETLQYGIYSHKTDVWSYGVTLWEIFTFGKRPYENVDTVDIKDHVMKGGRLTQPDICTLDVYMVMVKCWMEDCESRPTFVELMRMFNNFCKTPGRYLYIQGDEYAINNYFGNTYSGAVNLSTESHELQPILVHRGASDGSTVGQRNGSLHRPNTVQTDTSLTPSHALGRQHSGLSEQLGTRTRPPIDMDALGMPGDPDESQLLLPVRSNNFANPSASSFVSRQARSRGAVVPSSNPSVAMVTGLGRIWKRSNATGFDSPSTRHQLSTFNTDSQNKAPLAVREESWLVDPSKSSPASSPIRSKPLTNVTMPSRFTFDSTTGINHPSNQTEYLSVPRHHPPLISPEVEDYLQPKAQLSGNRGTNVFFTNSRTSSNRPPSGNTTYTELSPCNLSDVTANEDEYLNPTSMQTAGYLPCSNGFGVTNPEYMMQPSSTNNIPSRNESSTESMNPKI